MQYLQTQMPTLMTWMLKLMPGVIQYYWITFPIYYQRTIGPVSLIWVLRICWIRKTWKYISTQCCLSFHLWNKFDPVTKMVKVNPGSSYENIGSTRVPWCCIPSFKVIGLLVPLKKIFEVFHHIWAWSCDLEYLNKFSFLTSHGGSIWNLASICLAVSEQKKFENTESEWP